MSGRYHQGPMPTLHYHGDWTQELRREPLHAVLAVDPGDVELLDIGEPIQITMGNPPRYAGMAEVIAVKRCRIADLEPDDLRRQKEGFRSKREIVSTLRQINPETAPSITLGTIVTLITFRRHSYSLKALEGWRRNAPVPKKPARKKEPEV